MKKHILHLNKPAAEWEDCSPIGNGSMGAALFGGTDTEKIYLSEESIWSGEERDTTVKDFRRKVDIIRDMHLNGRDAEIDQWADENLTEGIERIRSVEYAGLLTVDRAEKGEAADYSRDIDLNTGIYSCTFTKNGVGYREEAFSAYADEVTAIRFTSSDKTSMNIRFSREYTDSTEFSDSVFTAVCHTAYGDHHFAVGVKFISDGKIDYQNGAVGITGATDTILFISITTEFNFYEDYKSLCAEVLEEAFDYDELKESHIEDFTSLSERSDISLEHPAELDELSVDERLERLKNDENAEDMGLWELYYAFGKYLMISSSRPSTLPANLQGVWVEKLENPWNADYHTNINIQMNYWLCEVANLSECHEPLFDYMNEFLLKSGRKTAEVNYKCRGTVTHHLSDIYGFTTPADGLWGIWPMGGAWLAYHMWEHYLFTLDKDFLRDTAYEYIRDCALFFIDYMFEDKDGKLVTGPSMSPENRFLIDTPDGAKEAYLTFAPTMDTEIIGGLLKFYIRTEEILGISEEYKQQAQRVLSRLPELKVGKHGQLMEWREDYDEPEPGHRHISHSFALYPDNAITRKTPELFAAIEKTLDRRLSFGGGHTGWSRAWLISLFARLKKGGKAYENTRLLLTKSTNGNLFDTHPPFQIDGNFGGAAGIAETLIQSHEDFISILPAVTDRFTGYFKGLKARGNIEVNADFREGKLLSLEMRSLIPQTVRIEISPSPDGKEPAEDQLITAVLPENEFVTIRF